MYSTYIIRTLLIPLFISMQLQGMQKEMVTHAMPNMFHSLPPGLLEKVAKRLDARALSTFVRTCTVFKNVAVSNPRVLKAVNRRGRRVCIEGSAPFYEINEELMDYCARGYSRREKLDALLKNPLADIHYRKPFDVKLPYRSYDLDCLGGRSLLGAACFGCKEPLTGEWFSGARQSINFDLVEYLLNQGTNPNDYGPYSALNTVLIAPDIPFDVQIQCIELLIAHGANLYKLSLPDERETVLHVAAGKDPRLLAYFLANTEVPIDSVGSLGQTPLTRLMFHLNIHTKKSPYFKVCLDAFTEKNANSHVKDQFGFSAYSRARRMIEDQFSCPDLEHWFAQQKEEAEFDQHLYGFANSIDTHVEQGAAAQSAAEPGQIQRVLWLHTIFKSFRDSIE